MIRQCYRAGSHDGGLLPSYEEYARLADAKAAGANSSAHIMITGHLAPPPASAGGYRVRRQDVEGKCTSCGIGPAVGRVWTASSASQRRRCRQFRGRSGRRRPWSFGTEPPKSIGGGKAQATKSGTLIASGPLVSTASDPKIIFDTVRS